MRAVLAILVMVAVGFVLYVSIKSSPNQVVANDNPDVRIAARHEAATQELARALDEAIANAKQAEQTATRLEEAVAKSRATSRELFRLRRNNDAVPTSVDAISITTDKGERAARMMRIYASRLNDGLADAEQLSDQAVEMAQAIENVEESQAQADEAMAKASALRAEVNNTARQQTRVSSNTPRPQLQEGPVANESDVHIRVIEEDHDGDRKVDRIVIGQPGG